MCEFLFLLNRDILLLIAQKPRRYNQFAFVGFQYSQL
jgi:hypothetical protein